MKLGKDEILKLQIFLKELGFNNYIVLLNPKIKLKIPHKIPHLSLNFLLKPRRKILYLLKKKEF